MMFLADSGEIRRRGRNLEPPPLPRPLPINKDVSLQGPERQSDSCHPESPPRTFAKKCGAAMSNAAKRQALPVIPIPFPLDPSARSATFSCDVQRVERFPSSDAGALGPLACWNSSILAMLLQHKTFPCVGAPFLFGRANLPMRRYRHPLTHPALSTLPTRRPAPSSCEQASSL